MKFSGGTSVGLAPVLSELSVFGFQVNFLALKFFCFLLWSNAEFANTPDVHYYTFQFSRIFLCKS